jgi:hypothetical protein
MIARRRRHTLGLMVYSRSTTMGAAIEAAWYRSIISGCALPDTSFGGVKDVGFGSDVEAALDLNGTAIEELAVELQRTGSETKETQSALATGSLRSLSGPPRGFRRPVHCRARYALEHAAPNAPN